LLTGLRFSHDAQTNPLLALRRNRAGGFPSPQEKTTLDRQSAIIEGTRTGLRMIETGQFDDEEPFHVIAAFVMREIEDANVGEVTLAMAALAECNEQNGIVMARTQKFFRESDSPDMTVEAAVRRSVSEGNRQPIMFSRWLL
jgi:hypothetical protein